MEISFYCDKCGQHVAIDESGAGQLVDCPKCARPMEVPYRSNPVVTPPAQAPVKPLQPPTKRSSPLLVAAVVVLGLLCAGLGTIVLLLTRSKSTPPGPSVAQYQSHLPSSPVAAAPMTRVLDKVLPDITVNGEVFIVTKAGVSIKLGLVPVDLIPLADLSRHLSAKTSAASNEITRLKPLVAVAEADYRHIDKQKDAEYARLWALSEQLHKQASEILQKPIPRLDDMANYEAWEKENAARNKKYSELSNAASKATTDAFAARDAGEEKAEKAKRKWYDLDELEFSYRRPSFCFDGLPSAFRSTKTDGDGKFQITVPRSGRYVIAAFAKRELGNASYNIEEYYWLIEIDPRGESQQKVMLSNDNQFHGLPGLPDRNP
jgi:hypothetical protein